MTSLKCILSYKPREISSIFRVASAVKGRVCETLFLQGVSRSFESDPMPGSRTRIDSARSFALQDVPSFSLESSLDSEEEFSKEIGFPARILRYYSISCFTG